MRNTMPRMTPRDGIEALGLTARARNALKARGIETIADVLAMSDWDVHITPGLGPVSIADIEGALKRAGHARRQRAR